jgi:hypothetical protein
MKLRWSIFLFSQYNNLIIYDARGTLIICTHEVHWNVFNLKSITNAKSKCICVKHFLVYQKYRGDNKLVFTYFGLFYKVLG